LGNSPEILFKDKYSEFKETSVPNSVGISPSSWLSARLLNQMVHYTIKMKEKSTKKLRKRERSKKRNRTKKCQQTFKLE